MQQHSPDVPLIDRIKITAEWLLPVIREMEQELGRERAHAIVRAGISEQFRAMAREASSETRGNPMATLQLLNKGVRAGVDLETDVLRRDDGGFDMDVTSCIFARFFQELNEPELGFILVCSGDFDQVAALDNVRLERTTTIMQGADRCDFRYRFLTEPVAPSEGRAEVADRRADGSRR